MPKRKRKHQGQVPEWRKQYTKKLFLTHLVMVLVGIIVTSFVVILVLPEPIVSSDAMDKYAQTLISDYNQSLSFYLPSMFDQFQFWSNASYSTKAIISSQFGAALLIYPANEWSFNSTATNQRIENAVFGKDNLDQGTRFILTGQGFVFLVYQGNSTARMTVSGIGFVLGDNNASVMFNRIYINSVYYFFLIVKGDNLQKSWSDNAASNDARYIFSEDIYFALNKSESIREHYAQPDLDAKLIDILSKWRNQLLINGSIVYPPDQMAYDLNQLETYAKTQYGITNNDFINDSLAYLESIPLPTPIPAQPRTILGINDPENWVYSSLLSLYPLVLYGVFLIFQSILRKHPDESFKFLTTTVILEIFLGATVGGWFFVSYPALSILQIIFVGFIWAFGIAILHYGRKKLFSLRLSRVNNANTTEKKTQDKASSTPVTKEK